MMEIRYSTHPDQVKTFTTEEIRKHYLLRNYLYQAKLS